MIKEILMHYFDVIRQWWIRWGQKQKQEMDTFKDDLWW